MGKVVQREEGGGVRWGIFSFGGREPERSIFAFSMAVPESAEQAWFCREPQVQFAAD